MSDIVRSFNTVVALLPDPAIADVPRTWLANGPRGYRHGSRFCDKLRRAATLLTTDPSAPSEEVFKRPCPACFVTGFISSQPNASALHDLVRLKEGLDELLTRHDNKASLAQLNSTSEGLRRILVHLDRMAAKPEAMDHYGSTITRMSSTIRGTLAELRSALIGRSEELLVHVALELMSPSRSAAPFHAFSDEDQRTLDGCGTPTWAMLSMFDRWKESAAVCRPVNVEEMLEHARANTRLTHLSQLENVPALAYSPGLASSKDVAEKAWEGYRDNLVREMLARWDSTLTELRSRSSLKLAALFEYRGQALASQVIEAYRVYSRIDGKVTVLRVPEFVAGWLEALAAEPSYRSILALGSRVHVCDNTDDMAAIDTAASLWDPAEQEGPYSTFLGAVNAAKALLS